MEYQSIKNINSRRATTAEDKSRWATATAPPQYTTIQSSNHPNHQPNRPTSGWGSTEVLTTFVSCLLAIYTNSINDKSKSQHWNTKPQLAKVLSSPRFRRRWWFRSGLIGCCLGEVLIKELQSIFRHYQINCYGIFLRKKVGKILINN